jgi:hypothetical protein
LTVEDHAGAVRAADAPEELVDELQEGAEVCRRRRRGHHHRARVDLVLAADPVGRAVVDARPDADDALRVAAGVVVVDELVVEVVRCRPHECGRLHAPGVGDLIDVLYQHVIGVDIVAEDVGRLLERLGRAGGRRAFLVDVRPVDRGQVALEPDALGDEAGAIDERHVLHHRAGLDHAERDGLDQGIVGHQRVLRQGYGIGRDCHRLLRAVVRRRGSRSALALEEARRAQPGRVLGVEGGGAGGARAVGGRGPRAAAGDQVGMRLHQRGQRLVDALGVAVGVVLDGDELPGERGIDAELRGRRGDRRRAQRLPGAGLCGGRLGLSIARPASGGGRSR